MLTQLVKIKGFKLRFDSAQSLFSHNPQGSGIQRQGQGSVHGGDFNPFLLPRFVAETQREDKTQQFVGYLARYCQADLEISPMRSVTEGTTEPLCHINTDINFQFAGMKQDVWHETCTLRQGFRFNKHFQVAHVLTPTTCLWTYLCPQPQYRKMTFI